MSILDPSPDTSNPQGSASGRSGETASPMPRSRLWSTLQAVLRARVTAGLVFVLPLWITYLLLRFIFELMRDTSYWVVDWYLRGRGDRLVESWGVTVEEFAQKGVSALPAQVQWGVAIFSVLLTVFFLYCIGVLTANIVGRRLVRIGESILEYVPFVKTIYKSSKQILQTIAGETGQNFQRVVLIPFPSKEVRSIGFVTSSSRDTTTGEDLYSVYLPTAPSPTGGFVIVVRKADVIELDWTVENALKTIISGGVLGPDMIPLMGQPPPAQPARRVSEPQTPSRGPASSVR